MLPGQWNKYLPSISFIDWCHKQGVITPCHKSFQSQIGANCLALGSCKELDFFLTPWFLWWLLLWQNKPLYCVPRLVIFGVRSVILPGRVMTPETHVLPRKGLTIVYFLWVWCVLHHFNQSDCTLLLWKCGILTLWISNKIACSDWPTKQKRSQWSLFILRKNHRHLSRCLWKEHFPISRSCVES